MAVDLRKKSKTYGKHFSCVLSEKNAKSIYIPPGFAHGFCTLDKENYIIYSCTKYRSANSEVGIKYNDKDLKINWPIKKPIISKKDNSNYSEVFKSATKQALEDFKGKKILIGRARMFEDKTKNLDDPGMLALNKLSQMF